MSTGELHAKELNVTSRPNRPKCPHFNKCPIFLSATEKFEFSLTTQMHLEEFDHPKQVCKHGDECFKYNRLKDGYTIISDLCHMHLFYHPSRGRAYNKHVELNTNNFKSSGKSLHVYPK